MENLLDLRGRLKWLIETSGVSAREASRLAGQSSPAYVGMLIRKDIDSPTTRTAESLALVFGCSVGWLVAGEGDAPTDEAIRAAIATARERQGAPDPTATEG